MALERTPIHIGQVIRNAIRFAPQNWRGGPMNADALPQAVAALFSLLRQRQIDYLLVGGIAMLQYVAGRNTEDIDLIVAVADLKKLPELQIQSQELYFARGQFEDLRIDLLLTDNPLFEKVQHGYATSHQFVESEVRCATVEGLLLLKLYALPSLYRQGDFARVGLYENDIATLLHYYQPHLPALLDELKPHLSDTDFAEVGNIIAEIRQRLDRFQQSQENGEEE
jgi:hypothetical protein